MSRLTLRLPETLHQQLSKQANREGISLNQCVTCGLPSANLDTDCCVSSPVRSSTTADGGKTLHRFPSYVTCGHRIFDLDT